jgi:hypothetical protein
MSVEMRQSPGYNEIVPRRGNVYEDE